MLVLSVDTSCSTAQVALTQDGTVICEAAVNNKKNHSVKLMPEVQRLFEESGKNPSDIDMIACVNGPGSYTGLRIGMAACKLLAYTLGKPLVPVKTLDFLAASSGIYDSKALICACIDARNTQIFYAFYNYGQNNGSLPMRIGNYAADAADKMCVEALKILKEGGLSKIYFTGDGLIANRKLIRSIIGDEYYREGTAVNLLGRAAFAALLAEQCYTDSSDSSFFAPENAEIYYLRTPKLTVKKISGGENS